MKVEISLAELLMNSIAAGRVRGVQFKRGWSDEQATFDDLKAVVGARLDGARRVAVEGALRQLRDEHPMYLLRRENEELRARLAALREEERDCERAVKAIQEFGRKVST